MRQIVLLAMILLVASNVFSQPSNTKPTLSQQDYLEKSKKQKTAGKILAIGGAGLMVAGIAIPQGELLDPYCSGWWCSEEHDNDEIKGRFILAGTLTMLSSVPLFIVAGKNQKRATSVSFKNENTLQLSNQNLVYTSVPAVRVKVDF